MSCESYGDEYEHFTRIMCLNQIFRPKEKIPKKLRPKDMGDCTTCKPCPNNSLCKSYIPVSLVIGKDDKE